MTTITRFAPSPTGNIHLGHAYSALFAERQARDSGGKFLLRMEDIDGGRCKPEFETSILEDLAWLGLVWEQPVRRQSDHMDDYESALATLRDEGVLYPCFCSRADIRHEIAAAGHAPHDIPNGPDGPLYPGTCRSLSEEQRAERTDSGAGFAMRLDMATAVHLAGDLQWSDRERGVQLARPELFGDIVLARKDTPTSYHLAVTLDDHLQGVTLVTRGVDLFAASHVHRLLQSLLDLDVPEYFHHPLITDESGRRFAKRDTSKTLAELRNHGASNQDIRQQLEAT